MTAWRQHTPGHFHPPGQRLSVCVVFVERRTLRGGAFKSRCSSSITHTCCSPSAWLNSRPRWVAFRPAWSTVGPAEGVQATCARLQTTSKESFFHKYPPVVFAAIANRARPLCARKEAGTVAQLIINSHLFNPRLLRKEKNCQKKKKGIKVEV